MSDLSSPLAPFRVLLLESIHPNAVDVFRSHGAGDVVRTRSAPGPDELARLLAGVHLLGIRSRTAIPPGLLRKTPALVAIGCFSAGANNVPLAEARELGIPVFNAPYANTRSVAELVISETTLLLRRIPEKNEAAHRGVWKKTAERATEVRGKTIGIIGYGHIGAQVSVLAEAMGMRVVFFDIRPRLALGNAEAMPSLDRLLEVSDAVTLHVPATRDTCRMMDGGRLARMRPGAVLLNASRGDVVDIDALAGALRSGHCGGAAIDVFPREPKTNDDLFASPLRGLANVILTPHIGGSTEEAQARIGTEVAEKLSGCLRHGATAGALNFPGISLAGSAGPGRCRFLHIHRNVPGVMQAITAVFTARALNIGAQRLQTDGGIGYAVTDVDTGDSPDIAGILAALGEIPGTVKHRHLASPGE